MTETQALKYYNWYCNTVVQAHQHKRAALELIVECLPEILNEAGVKKKRRINQFWEARIFKERSRVGFYTCIFPLLKLDKARFENYFRMTRTQFEHLIQLIGPCIIRHRETSRRTPISVEERLAVTLRYLASGDSMVSLSYVFLISKTSISNIIYETCAALWIKLKPEVLAVPTMDDWRKIAEGFEASWNFPHCISCIDGKHIHIQKPKGAGSEYYNYKKFHSIVLMAACDHRYAFTLVDIGAQGRQSDGGVLAASKIGKKLESQMLDIPPPCKISGSNTILPYVCLGDQGFALRPYLLRPYPERRGNEISFEERIFNYRLCRARRVIENTFGLAASVWRILRKPIIADITTIDVIVKAIVCLQNFLIKCKEGTFFDPSMVDSYTEDGRTIPGSWRIEGDNVGILSPLEQFDVAEIAPFGTETRNKFRDFFAHEGAVPWQFLRMYESY